MTATKPLARAAADAALRRPIKARIIELTVRLVDAPPGARREICATIGDLEQLLARAGQRGS